MAAAIVGRQRLQDICEVATWAIVVDTAVAVDMTMAVDMLVAMAGRTEAVCVAEAVTKT